MGITLATDLDRTLLPNGTQPYDRSMPLFSRLVKKKNIHLIYVTGRYLAFAQRGIEQYHAPHPKYYITDVGTRIFRLEGRSYIPDTRWQQHIKKQTPKWNVRWFRRVCDPLPRLKLQENIKQNPYKLSYYVTQPFATRQLIQDVTCQIESLCPSAIVVYSIDEKKGHGLLDILPKSATKVAALEYVRKRMSVQKSRVVYCGDSGNDILPLTFGYRAILVRNAIPSVRKEVRELTNQKGLTHKLHIAKGQKKLNGYYVSGIIEGLLQFGIISEEDLELN